jgi:DeoR/GlpR family transcriptional regulator of sugar metabolism
MDEKPESASGEQIVGLLSEPRRRRILEWIQEEGSVRVRELVDAFRVSDATIRQDLERLEKEGMITREHGGAFLNRDVPQTNPLMLHHQENMDKKRRIGAYAANLVSNGETIILDAGTTTTEVAVRLADRRDLTIITNALNIAILLGSEPSFAIHLPGGQFKSPTLSVSGDKSVEYFSDIFAGKLFLATAGVDLEAGLTYPSFADLQLKEAMIKAAAHVYLVADSTKIGKSSFTRLGSLKVIQSLITDDGISDAAAKEFERRGVEILIAN